MTRIPPAARLLINEVQTYDQDVIGVPDGEPDGFGVVRTIRFDPAPPWLRDALDIATEDDDRVAAVHGKKHVLVDFVATARADYVEDGFDIATIAAILNSPDEGDTEPEQQQGQDESDDDDGSEPKGEPGESSQ